MTFGTPPGLTSTAGGSGSVKSPLCTFTETGPFFLRGVEEIAGAG